MIQFVPALGFECSRSELGHPFVIMLMQRFGKMIAAIDLLDDGGQKASNKNIYRLLHALVHSVVLEAHT